MSESERRSISVGCQKWFDLVFVSVLRALLNKMIDLPQNTSGHTNIYYLSDSVDVCVAAAEYY